jgi:hypothetical protein
MKTLLNEVVEGLEAASLAYLEAIPVADLVEKVRRAR